MNNMATEFKRMNKAEPLVAEPPPDECPECGSTRRDYHKPTRGDIFEPACENSVICYDCGHPFPEDDEATRRGL